MGLRSAIDGTMTHSRAAVRVRIEGRVQGVGFRAFVERVARARGLDGFVRNRRDGGVEAVLAGPDALVDEALARGPSGARVDMVHRTPAAGPVDAGFEVHPTV